jgi:hypothetical protein
MRSLVLREVFQAARTMIRLYALTLREVCCGFDGA